MQEFASAKLRSASQDGVKVRHFDYEIGHIVEL